MRMKSESVAFTAVKEADFHLYLDFLCPLIVVTTNMMPDKYRQLQTGHMKII